MNPKSQIFIQFPNSQIQALTLDPNCPLTLRHLKLSLFPAPAAAAQQLQPVPEPEPEPEPVSSFYFTINGKFLPDSTHIPNPRVPPLSTLFLRPRLLGGGGDGGATGAESRDCYLNMYAEKKPDKVDPNEQRLSKWLNCALSGEPLTQPCVMDALGNVFNKESLVEALIKKKLPKGFGYIKGLKDMIDIKLEPIPREELRNSGAKFHCPITGLEFNGKYKFFALRKCGHVLSAKALKEVKSSACLVCYKEFEESDKIVINGSEEEVEALRERMEEEKAAKVKDKKQKKVKNGEVVGNGEDSGATGLDSFRLSGKKHGLGDEVKGVDKVSGKVEVNGKVGNGKGLSNGGGAVKKFKATDIAPPNANKEVYASIFTSSKKSEFKETFTCRSLPLGRN